MTSKEAKSCINTIKMLQRLAYNIHGVMDVIDADNCEKIIKALDQEPSGETVSLEAFKQVMWERDIAIGQLKELGYDFGQKIEPYEYVISLEAVIEWLKAKDIIKMSSQEEMARKELKAFPPVTAEPKTGHWIMHEKHRECSECTVWLPKDMPRNSFCPNCGAKMVEPQESEDKG